MPGASIPDAVLNRKTKGTNVMDNKNYPHKENIAVTRNKKLEKLMDESNQRDYRHMYMDAPHGYKVTAVTRLLDEITIIIAFSFCSPKDNFCKKDGRIKCLERISNYENMGTNPNDGIDTDYVITLPSAGIPAVMTMGYAYNLLTNKPARLEDTKFFFNVNGHISTHKIEKENIKLPEWYENSVF